MQKTDWIDVGFRPMANRPGYYQVRVKPETAASDLAQVNFGSLILFRYWDGTHWRSSDRQDAWVLRGKTDRHEWRGLTKPSSK